MFLMGLVQPKFELGVVLSGFALFMVGVNFLGDGLTELAGTKINDYIEKYTGNLFMAMLVGALITAIMHSSTAATVISISLVRAGMMSLEQAIGISVGANLGTTMTSLIIGLNVEKLGHYLVFIGAILLIFVKRKQLKNIGTVLFGFGILFVGLEMMSDKLLVLQDYTFFNTFMYSLKDHPWLALGGSTLATVIINSSTAVVGITQKLFVTGEMDMVVASAFVFGSNVGTTLTAVLASAGGSVSTKRAGWFHVVYNILGALLGMLIIYPYSKFITYLNTLINGTPEMAVGVNHFVFNLASMLLVIPFIPMMIKLLKVLIPGEDRIKSRAKIEPMDQNLIQVFPEGALQLAKKTTLNMAELVYESVEMSRSYLVSKDIEDHDVVGQLEEMVNRLDTDITSYLLNIAKTGYQSEAFAEDYTKGLNIVKNYERMSDLALNLVEFYNVIYGENQKFTEEAMQDLNTMYDLLLNIITRTTHMFDTEDLNDYDGLVRDEEYLDLIELKYREKHFQRMKDGICVDQIAASLYVDILGTMERIGDHSMNVSRNIFSVVKVHENVYEHSE